VFSTDEILDLLLRRRTVPGLMRYPGGQHRLGPHVAAMARWIATREVLERLPEVFGQVTSRFDARAGK
jgi:hypothetical protein